MEDQYEEPDYRLNDDIEIELLDVAESSNGDGRGADLRRGSNGAGEDQDDENGPLSNWKINAQESLLPKIRSKEEIREIKQRNEDVANFYKNQNLLIFDFLRLDKDEKEGDEEEDDSDFRVRFAIYASFCTNVVLLFIKIVAFFDSGSIAVLASVLDSFLDLLSGFVIFFTSILQKRNEPYLYPAGKRRIEPLGVIIFATAMFVATFNLVVEAVQTMADGGNDDLDITIVTLGIIAATVAAKVILFVFCYSLRSLSTSCDALAVDHRNDVISNTFGLAFAVMGQQVYWMLDPLGALLIAAYLMYNWWQTGAEQVGILSGKSASNAFISKVTYLCWNHHRKIMQIDTVKAYYVSDSFLVQVDIVLPAEMSVKESHDIAESLQFKIESLPEVERCFVHIDYETSHAPEH